MIAANMYVRMTPGPAVRTAIALPRNSPVPIAPPMAIMPSWRCESCRASPCSRAITRSCSGNAPGGWLFIRLEPNLGVPD